MEYASIEAPVVRILQEHEGRYMLAYQIFKRIQRDSVPLAEQLLAAYPPGEGRPDMGKNAGTYYSVATFIAQALDHFRKTQPHIKKGFLVSEDIQNDEIQSGDPKGLSIWAWTYALTNT